MKVKQTGYYEPDDATRYLIYDETAEKKPEPPPLQMNVPDHVKEDVAEKFHRMGENLWGHAYGRPHLCNFSIYGVDRIEYEFDSAIIYTQDVLDMIQQKAKAARARLKKKREQEAKGNQPTLFDMEEKKHG